MKVIGKGERDTFIGEFSQSEIQEFLNVHFRDKKDLKVGDEVDLGRGYNFAREVKRSVESINATIEGANQIAVAVGILQELAKGIPEEEGL